MRVRRADQTEAERIEALFFFQGEAVQVGVTHVAALRLTREVAADRPLHDPEVRPLVIGGQERMGV